MVKKVGMSCLVVVLGTLCALADPPKIGIPTEVKVVGEYAKWMPDSTTTAKGISYVGLSKIDPLPSEMLKDPRVFLLPVRGLKSGKYRFRAIGSLNDEHVQEEFTVQIGDNTEPVDNPTDPVTPDKPKPKPDGVYGLMKASREGRDKVSSVNKVKEAAKLAGSTRGTASAIVAGGAGNTAKEFLEKWREGNTSSGIDQAVWKPWADSVAAQLSTLYKAGKLPGKSEWAAAFNEIADGLEQ